MLWQRARDRWALALAVLIALPLSPLMFHMVRLPIDGWLRTTYGIAGWVSIVALFYAPLTEEPAKWLTAAVPKLRRAIAAQPVPMALATGAGFGIGEIWFLASALNTADHSSLPFYAFGGFMLERAAVCFLHGAFLAPPFVALARGRLFALGGLIGMLLHFLLNFPIYLAQVDPFRLGSGWIMLLALWMLGFLAGCIVLVRHLAAPPLQPNSRDGKTCARYRC